MPPHCNPQSRLPLTRPFALPPQVARRRNEQGFEELYTVSRCGNGSSVLCMMVFAPGKGCRCSTRSSVAGLGALMTAALEAILA